MAKRTIGKPRFYADMFSYLKSLGYYTGSNSGGVLNGSDENVSPLWNMNPVQTNKFSINHSIPSGYNFGFTVSGGTQNFSLTDENAQLSRLLSQANYAGILNHNLGTLKDPNGNTIEGIKVYYSGDFLDPTGIDRGFGLAKNTSTNAIVDENTEIVNCRFVASNKVKPEYNGYSLWQIKEMPKEDDPFVFGRIIMVIHKIQENQISTTETEIDTANIGAFTFGRFFEPSHSPDLSVKLIKSYEGANIQTTVGGSTITNFNHLGQPHWGDLPAWTLEKQEGHDYKIGAERGRRTWQVTLSYMSDSDVFSTSTNENKFFTWDEELGESGYTFDSSMASFFNLTHNGNLRFIFCPDKDADNKEFALCVIDQDSLTYTQVAHRTWSVSMNIMEVW